jgi:hypothetical protein
MVVQRCGVATVAHVSDAEMRAGAPAWAEGELIVMTDPARSGVSFSGVSRHVVKLVDVRPLREIEFEPHDLAVVLTGFVAEADTGCHLVQQSQSSTARSISRDIDGRLRDDVAEGFGRCLPIVHLNPYRRVDADDDRHLGRGVADNVRDELTRQQSRDRRVQATCRHLGRHETTGNSDTQRGWIE